MDDIPRSWIVVTLVKIYSGVVSLETDLLPPATDKHFQDPPPLPPQP